MNFKKTKLNNGLRIITVPMKNTETVTAMVLVNVGSDNESKDKNGISHFLEHMCFQGTKNRPNVGDVGKELDSLGAENNAFTGKEYTGYWAKAHKRHSEKITDIVSDIFLNPVFPEDAIQREKGVVVEEMKMYEDLPQFKVGEVFEELLYGDQPAGWSIIGNEKNVRSLSREDLVSWREGMYKMKNTIFVISGNINEKKIIEQVKKLFKGKVDGGIKKPKLILSKQDSPRVKIFKKETDQIHIVLGFNSVQIGDKDLHKISVLKTVLGTGMSSRLFSRLRDKLGICYYVKTVQDSFSDRGYFAISCGVSRDRVEEAVSAIVEELKKLKEEKVLEQELKKAKELMIGGMYLGLEGSDDFADFCAFQEIYNQKIKTPEEKVKKIESVKARDVMDMAKAIFSAKNSNIALVGNFTDEVALKTILGKI